MGAWTNYGATAAAITVLSHQIDGWFLTSDIDTVKEEKDTAIPEPFRRQGWVVSIVYPIYYTNNKNTENPSNPALEGLEYIYLQYLH